MSTQLIWVCNACHKTKVNEPANNAWPGCLGECSATKRCPGTMRLIELTVQDSSLRTRLAALCNERKNALVGGIMIHPGEVLKLLEEVKEDVTVPS